MLGPSRRVHSRSNPPILRIRFYRPRGSGDATVKLRLVMKQPFQPLLPVAALNPTLGRDQRKRILRIGTVIPSRFLTDLLVRLIFLIH